MERHIRFVDVAAIYQYESHPQFMEHYPWTERKVDEARAFVDMCIAWVNEQPRIKFQLVITSRETGVLIGTCGIRKDVVDSGCADLGFALAVEYWGQGFATEAARAMVQFAFENLGVEEVDAICVQANDRSVGVLERLGFGKAECLPKGRGKDGNIYPERYRFVLHHDQWCGK